MTSGIWDPLIYSNIRISGSTLKVKTNKGVGFENAWLDRQYIQCKHVNKFCDLI